MWMEVIRKEMRSIRRWVNSREEQRGKANIKRERRFKYFLEIAM